MKTAILAACSFLWSAIFKPAIGSVNGALIPAELKKIAAAATTSSTVVGILLAVLQAVLPDVGALFPSPVVSALVTLILTYLVGQLGAMQQSQTGTRLSHDGGYPEVLHEI